MFSLGKRRQSVLSHRKLCHPGFNCKEDRRTVQDPGLSGDGSGVPRGHLKTPGRGNREEDGGCLPHRFYSFITCFPGVQHSSRSLGRDLWPLLCCVL